MKEVLQIFCDVQCINFSAEFEYRNFIQNNRFYDSENQYENLFWACNWISNCMQM